MAIKITTDSTCDLAPELLKQHDISVIPLGVVMGGTYHQDGIDISPAKIAQHVANGGDLPTTSAVNLGGYYDVFNEYLKQYDAVIHVNIGAEFSSCYQNACLAAMDLQNVYVADSRNLCVGHGMMVLAAAEAAEAGKSPTEILEIVKKKAPRVECSFVLNQLDYLAKGGRCSSVAALGANLLKLHPCIEVIDGEMAVVKKYRGAMEKVITDYIRERVTNRDDIDRSRVYLVDAAKPELVQTARRVLQESGGFDEIIESHAGCTIFSHCGPDTLGIIYLRNQ